MSEESVTVFLRAQIGEFTGKMKEAGGEVESLGKKGSSGFSKFQAVGSAALLAVGTAALAVGAYGLKMADEYESAHARLETAVKNSGGDFDRLKGKVGAVSKTMEALGFTNTETESSIATLTGVTHDAEKAMSLEGLAADIARGRHIDLATATGILVKVESGHVASLGRLGIQTKDATGKTIDQETAIRRLTDLYGGQAAAYTDTFAGKIAVLKTRGEDLAKNIGLMLIPVLERTVSIGLGVVTFFQHANDATGGWLGKVALIAIAAPLAVVAISKLVSGVGSMITLMTEGAQAATTFGVGILSFAAANPEITALVAVAAGIGLVVGALHIWGGAHDAAKKEAKDFTTALDADTDSLGKNTNAIGENTSALIRKKLTDANQIDDLGRLNGALSNGKTAWETWMDAVNGSADAQRQIRQSMIDTNEVQVVSIGKNRLSKDELDKVTAAWVKNGGSIDDVNKTLGLHNSKFQKQEIEGNTGLVKSLDDQTAARKASKSALDDEIKSGVRNTDGTLKNTETTKTNTTTTSANTAALQARTAALNQRRDAVLGAIGADLSMDDALHTLSTDLADYNTKAAAVIASHGKDKQATDDLVSSTLQLRHGILDVVTAAVASAKAQDEERKAKGRNISADQESTDQTRAAIAALKDMKAQYPQLNALIQSYIDKLTAIPTQVTTSASLNIVEQLHNTGVVHVGPGLTRHATGGTIGPHELGLVGDAGTELVEGLAGGGALVHTNAATRRFLARPSNSRTAGTAVHLSIGDVNVVVSKTNASPHEIGAAVKSAVRSAGAEILDALLEHQRNGSVSVAALLERG